MLPYNHDFEKQFQITCSETSRKNVKNYLIPSGVIIDYPQYSFRGTMLDVSRHFFSVDDIKRHIEKIALYKINHLHLHLSDDQGWRIEIKSWPNLTLIGGQTQVDDDTEDNDYGERKLYYTQTQFKEIVEYADKHNVIIIPEVEMPGHTNAALCSYAELNSDGKPTQHYTGRAVGFSSLDAKKEITYAFVDDVIRELSELTPGPYIHIGGDESNQTPKEEYVDFIHNVEQIVHSYGKIMIGWEEIETANLNESSIVQLWKPKTKMQEIKRNGTGNSANRNYILSPADKVYLDMKYNTNTSLGIKWAGYIPVEISYSWDITSIMTREGITSHENVLGFEAPLWTETILTTKDIDYMVFPRLLSIAEIGWTSQKDRLSWMEYKERLGYHKKRFQAHGINFYASPDIPWNDENMW